MSLTSPQPILRTLDGEIQDRPPVWFMRQAGRHLPEYRDIRAKAKDFLNFCYSPSLATEVTLQPIRRYDMDAAILFADILLILDALGRKVAFVAGEGPVIDAVASGSDLGSVAAEHAAGRLAPVYETVSRVRAALEPSKTLIGFAGSPWTVAVYAVEGRGKTDRSRIKRWVYEQPADLTALLDALVEATAHYLKAQADAGADALMLFDSWAEGLPDDVFMNVITEPTRKLVDRLRSMDVHLPIIGFPRGAGPMIGAYARETGVNALGLGTEALPRHVASDLPDGFPIQGHLDPLLLLAGGDALSRRVEEIVAAYRDRPHIFNLGHGVLPDTPIPHVEQALAALRGQA